MRSGDVGSIKWDETILLGSGAFGDVFLGFLNEDMIAVKRVKLEDSNNGMNELIEREETAMKQMDHENVLKLLFVIQNQQYK